MDSAGALPMPGAALLWDDGTERSADNVFSWKTARSGVDMKPESAALRAGANAAATKRARGQPLMPKLHLRGSKEPSPRFEESQP